MPSDVILTYVDDVSHCPEQTISCRPFSSKGTNYRLTFGTCLCAGCHCCDALKGTVHCHIDCGSGCCFLKADTWRLVHNKLLWYHHREAQAAGSHSKDLISHDKALDTYVHRKWNESALCP